MVKVKVYSTRDCHWCRKTKEFFKKYKVNFEDFDVGEDEQARNEMIEKSNQMGVPVIDIDGEIIIGYDEERLKELLKIKN